MARRSEHSREELREMTLAAAIRIVDTEGFRALTARNVARAIGYTPGTLYNLFANLDDLAVHLNGNTLDRLYDLLVRAETIGEPETDLRTLLDVYFGFFEKHPNLWNLLFDHKLPDSVPLPEWYPKKVDRVFCVVEDALSPMFGPSQTEQKSRVARVLWASVHGFFSLATSGKLIIVSDQTVVEMADSLISNYLFGLRAEISGDSGHQPSLLG